MSFDHDHPHAHATPAVADAAPRAGKRNRTDRLRHRHGPRPRPPAAPSTAAAAAADPFDFGPSPPRVYRVDITHREPLGDGDGAWKSRLVVFLGGDAGVTEEARFALTYADGRPFPRGDLELIEAGARTASLRCRYNLATLPIDGRVQVTVPPPRAPELHPDGSIGDDAGSGLEA
ncbi:MAG: hypothetical protein JNK64_00125 [Myxococcales bacterium]|nr:hypothetical protein [Myxococcales bacterium]